MTILTPLSHFDTFDTFYDNQKKLRLPADFANIQKDCGLMGKLGHASHDYIRDILSQKVCAIEKLSIL